MRAVPLDPSQIETVGCVLGRAFQTDPPTNFIFPDPERRLPLLTSMFTELTRCAMKSGGGAFTLETPVAAIVWYRIDKQRSEDKTEEAKHGFISEWQPDELERAGRFFDHMQTSHARLMPETHGYLNFIGVDPGHQGQGHGGTLIQVVVDHFRKENLPCYLETATAQNVKLYEHCGFRVLEESTVPESPLHIWGMLRD
jgi:ribosomal protein S18 acetylase RimI-like enzyme